MKVAPRTTMTRCPNDTRHPHRADVDPDLEQQLALAADDAPVEAVLVLRQDVQDERYAAIPDRLLKRVCGNDPAVAVETTFLPRIGVLIVRARASIIRRLIEQPEIDIASANRVEAATVEGITVP